MSRGTTHHAFRADPGLWERAKVRAEQRGDNLSDVIRRALELYATDQHPTWASEVTPANTAHIATCPQCQETFRRT